MEIQLHFRILSQYGTKLKNTKYYFKTMYTDLAIAILLWFILAMKPSFQLLLKCVVFEMAYVSHCYQTCKTKVQKSHLKKKHVCHLQQNHCQKQIASIYQQKLIPKVLCFYFSKTATTWLTC